MAGFCPAMVLTTADSWPARYRSGATTTSTTDRVQAVLLPLVDGLVHGVHGVGVHVDEDLRGPEGPGRHRGPVEHEMGELVHQEPVLAAGRLAFGAVGHDHRSPHPGRSQGAPLGGQGEPRPALSPQPAALQLVEERDPRQSGRSPHRDRWSPSETVRPSAPTPTRSRSTPKGASTVAPVPLPEDRGQLRGHQWESPAPGPAVPVAVPDRPPSSGPPGGTA